MKNKHKLFKDISERFSQESHCMSKKVCALAVKDNRVLATGINGTASGQCNCDKHWPEIWNKENFSKYQRKASIRSPFHLNQEDYIDEVRKEMDKDYNDWLKSTEWREEHHKWSNQNELHAEQNLVAFAAREGISLKDCDIYVTLEPCMTCMKLLAALRPKNVYFFKEYDKNEVRAEEYFTRIGINCEHVKE